MELSGQCYMVFFWPFLQFPPLNCAHSGIV